MASARRAVMEGTVEMKITLCGSTRFKETFVKANYELGFAGHIVYSINGFGHADNLNMTEEDKRRLDLIHLKKILESDAVCVVGSHDDKTTYVGNSTRREIEWALLNSKRVYFWLADREHLVGSQSPFKSSACRWKERRNDRD